MLTTILTAIITVAGNFLYQYFLNKEKNDLKQKNETLQNQATSKIEADTNEEEQRKLRDEQLNKIGKPTLEEWGKLLVAASFVFILCGCTRSKGGYNWIPKIQAPAQIEYTEEDKRDLNEFSSKPVARKILNQGLAWRAIYDKFEEFRINNNRKCLKAIGIEGEEADRLLDVPKIAKPD